PSMEMAPSGVTVTVIGLRSSGMAWACVFGRLTGTPMVISGAATMKTISSTSMTSTLGVTLISLIGAPPARPRRLPFLPAEMPMPISGRLSGVELARQQRHKAIGKAVKAGGNDAGFATELVV